MEEKQDERQHVSWVPFFSRANRLLQDPLH